MIEGPFDLGGGMLVDASFDFPRVEATYPLSDAERALVAAAPFRHTPDGWREFAWQIHKCVLHGYRAGETDFLRMMEVMRGCSLGCEEHDRVALLALTADRALRLPRRALNRSAPPYPAWHRKAAIDLVLYLESLPPKRTTAEHREEAFAWLTSLRLATDHTIRRRPLADRTLQRWVNQYRQAQGQSRPSGRPRR